jgi:hypothetical protein
VKRAPELVPLSREHHEALVLARRACEPERPDAEPATLAAHLAQRWDTHFEPHFRREEQCLLPALAAAGAGAAAADARQQHGRLRALVASLKAGDLAQLPAWGAAMRDHVHWEERFLFPLAERLLDLPALQRQLAVPEAA